MNEEVLIPVILLAVIFGIAYISITSRHRQRMAMIDKGMDLGVGDPVDRTFRNLRNGMLMVGIGLGLFFGYLIDVNVAGPGVNGDIEATPLPYGMMILLCGGAALISHHFIVRRRS